MDEPVIGERASGPDAQASEHAATPESPVESEADATQLRPGARLQVAYVGPNRRAAFNSRVVGNEGGALALDLTQMPIEQAPPPASDPVILVTSVRGRYSAFDATVLGASDETKVLLVTPPVEARRPERRASIRVPLSIPLRSGTWLDPVGAEYPIKAGRVVDISTGGAQLRTQEQIPPGAVLRLAFSLHPAERTVLAQAMVTGAAWESGAGGLRLHVQFIEMSDESRAQLERFVTQAAARLPNAA